MTVKKAGIALMAASALIAGCAGQQTASQSSAPAPASQPSAATPAQSSTPDARTVKSRNGQFEGEIFGTPAPNSKFAKLQIGMTMREVSDLIGTPNDIVRHETGKRWIPFYYGNDAQRVQVFYTGEGCLGYTGGNRFGGGGNELIQITVDTKGQCLNN